MNKNTHFGFKKVASTTKKDMVSAVFNSVADKYDLMNDFMSAGLHRVWKQKAAELMHIQPGHHVCDVACGSGDNALIYAKIVGEKGCVTLTDINLAMLKKGREKLLCHLFHNTNFVLSDAESLPFVKNSFDRLSISFGLRNVTDKQRALESMFQVLRPGGRLMILEFSHPTAQWLKKGYDFYSFNILPVMGKWIAQDEESYRYLAESIRMHPPQEELLQMIKDAGFEQCQYTNMQQGIVAVHTGVKPD